MLRSCAFTKMLQTTCNLYYDKYPAPKQSYIFQGYIKFKVNKFAPGLLNYMYIQHLPLLYLSASTRAAIGQFSGPYSPVWLAKI